MKRLLFCLSLFCLSTVPLWAGSGDVWISSHTQTADTAKAVCPQRSNQLKLGHGILHTVCVNWGVTPLDGSFTVFNSSAVAINSLAVIKSQTSGCFNYDIGFSSGLSYTSVSTASVTMMYSCL